MPPEVVSAKGSASEVVRLAASTSVVVLSAGTSPKLMDVLRAACSCQPEAADVLLLWSGRGPAPSGPSGTRVLTINPLEFHHARTRQRAVEAVSGSFVAFLSDDAVPMHASWLGSLVAPFGDDRVGVVFGRQVAWPDASSTERAFRGVRYPDRDAKFRAGSDVPRLPPFSNANAAYRVGALRAIGGFDAQCDFGEDYDAAVRLLAAEWDACYSAKAAAWHSHDLTWRSTFRRAAYAGRHERSTGRGTGRGASGFMFSLMRRSLDLGGWHGLMECCVALSARVAGYAAGRIRAGFERARVPRAGEQ